MKTQKYIGIVGNWDSLCLPKSMRGLGFRDIGCFISALLAKQVWRIHRRECALLATILKARYYKHSDILNAMRGYDPSFTWRSLWGEKSLLKEGICWRVGNGLSIDPFEDKWIPMNGGARNLEQNAAISEMMKVSELIKYDLGH